MNRVRIFVYGSLKRGQVHHDEMRDARFEGVRATVDGYSLFRVGDYPAVAASGRGVVHGEVYWVTPEHLARLDDFEDCPHSYQRVRVELSDGTQAHAYTVEPERVAGRERIADGTWQGSGQAATGVTPAAPEASRPGAG